MKANKVAPEVSVVTTQPSTIQNDIGDFSRMPVTTVPKSNACCIRLTRSKAGIGLGLFSSGSIAATGAACLPATACGLNQALPAAAMFGLGLLGGFPGLTCFAGLAVCYVIKAKRAAVSEN